MIFAWVSSCAGLFPTLRGLGWGGAEYFLAITFPQLAVLGMHITLAIFLTVLHRNQNQE